MDDSILPNDQIKPHEEFRPARRIRGWKIVLGILGLFFLLYFFFLSAPFSFPVGSIFRIEQGNSLRTVSKNLKDKHIIRSRLAFEAFVIMFGGEKSVREADYFFEKKLPVFEVARRISKGEDHMAPIVVTIPEGWSVLQIAEAFGAELPDFNKEKFLLESEGFEGYLFPDTYFFTSKSDEANVLFSMRENFRKKIATLYSDISASGKMEKNIIIMASLIEGEAKGDSDRGIISGILWKRLAMGMPLQVDVAPETYKTTGLPKNPIGNPGIEAMKAAIYPEDSSYLYYLHDKEGKIHYAKSFSEHRQNIVRYLQ